MKKERLHRLFDLSDQISRELNEALVGLSPGEYRRRHRLSKETGA